MAAPPVPFGLDCPRPSPYPGGAAHAALRRAVRAFVAKEVAPHLEQWEEDGIMPRALHKIAAADPSGFYRLGMPEEYGGQAGDIWAKMAALEELVRAGSLGFPASLMTWEIALPPIAKHGSAALKEALLPRVASGDVLLSLAVTEPWGGSDVAAIRTKAVDAGDHYVVTGQKTFITTGCRADYFTTAVVTETTGYTGLSLLVIDSKLAGVKTAPMKKMGWWCSDTAMVSFDGVKVPKTHLIGMESAGFSYVMENFNGERLTMAAQSVAAARVCLEDAIAYARARKTFGKPLMQNQGIRWKLLDVAQEVEATHALLDQITWSYAQRGSIAFARDPMQVARLSLLKVKATRTLERAAREACQVFGGKSYLRTGPGARVERIYREVRVMAIGGGSEEIMLELASRQAKL
eukprot:TRINITY_DN9799_c0_g1_i1.p1 TRINITY_DN9799_c0_g1~~TRINITY_DN9799_c0_g1_i1.p1  ORF type:complete len:406 (+),score=153.11 TRINITY_DN9799_c0_g1_i1:1354-2571(+)